MSWIALNIPLAVLMVGFAAGLPVWVILRHPEIDRPVALDPEVLRPVRAATTDLPGSTDLAEPAALPSTARLQSASGRVYRTWPEAA